MAGMWSLLRPPEAPLAVRLRRRLTALRRDLGVVADDLRGRHPSPLIPRPPRAAAAVPVAAPTAAASARPLVVRALRRVTADATMVVLADPNGAPLPFTPGQFLTLLVSIDGVVHRRAYSICTFPAEALPDGPAGAPRAAPGEVAVCVKRIPGGTVSTFLHEQLAAGDVLPVLGPSGEFTVAAAPARGSLVLIAGGSGITPILALLGAALADPAGPRVTLVYGNRRPADVIFADELAALAAAHPDRFTLCHVLEEGAEAPALAGRLDAATVAAALDAAGADPDADHFVCGPTAAMPAVREALRARGVPPARLHEERFATPERRTAPGAAQPVTVRRGGVVLDLVVPPDATLLDAGLAAGVPMPFSCALGGCGACAIDLVDGEVVLDEPNCLAPEERARGRILACVARPAGPCTVVVP
jgi:ring-1,2-phenylacetyl-CoA epoxidase subunit PaaE